MYTARVCRGSGSGAIRFRSSRRQIGAGAGDGKPAEIDAKGTQWIWSSASSGADVAPGTCYFRKRVEKVLLVFVDGLGIGVDDPEINPVFAGQSPHLAGIAMEHHLTLFEYFQTDRAGHTGNMESACNVLALLDSFLSALFDEISGKDILLLLTSDHGNIEDVRVNTHTLNPVPLVSIGEGTKLMQERVQSITDVTPAISEVLP